MNRQNSTRDLKAIDFTLTPALDNEAKARATLDLNRLLLRDEQRYPWVILVPQRPGMVEIFDLLPGDQAQLWAEIARVSAALKDITGAQKVNIAALGI